MFWSILSLQGEESVSNVIKLDLILEKSSSWFLSGDGLRIWVWLILVSGKDTKQSSPNKSDTHKALKTGSKKLENYMDLIVLSLKNKVRKSDQLKKKDLMTNLICLVCNCWHLDESIARVTY